MHLQVQYQTVSISITIMKEERYSLSFSYHYAYLECMTRSGIAKETMNGLTNTVTKAFPGMIACENVCPVPCSATFCSQVTELHNGHI